MGLLSKFKIRRSDKPAPRGAASDPAEQIREVRIKARRRLIGVTLLLVAGIIGFPLLFETQPRPIPVDIPIEIPSRDGAAPMRVAAPEASSPRVATVAPPPVESTGSDAGAGEVIEPTVPASTSAAVAAPMPEPKTAEVKKPEPKPLEPVREKKPDSRSSDKTSDAHREVAKTASADAAAKSKDSKATDAKANNTKATDGKSSKSAAASKPSDAKPAETKSTDSKSDEGRFVVQIGAFAEANSARDARGKVELLGLSTYTQVIESSTGRRIRVRVGPYTTKAEADKAAAKIKAAGLQAAVLKL